MTNHIAHWKSHYLHYRLGCTLSYIGRSFQESFVHMTIALGRWFHKVSLGATAPLLGQNYSASGDYMDEGSDPQGDESSKGLVASGVSTCRFAEKTGNCT